MCRTVLVAVLALATSTVALDLLDVPGDIHPSLGVASLADRDLPRPETPGVPPSARIILEPMNPAQRANARISVEFESLDAEVIALGREVEMLWNSGRFDEALAQLDNLEARVGLGRVAVSVSWRTPVPTLRTDLWGDDVRIGDRDSNTFVAFDIDRASGNLFAVLLSTVGPSHRWSINISTDGGSAWAQTFARSTTYPMGAVSVSVLTNYCYVAFDGYASANRHVVLRRFRVSNGEDTVFSNGEDQILAYTAGAGDSIKEISLVSNADYSRTRLFYVALMHSGALKYIWSDSLAVDWDTAPATGVTNASHALDACTNEGYDSTFIWISYYDTADSLRIIGRRGTGFRNFWTKACGSGGRSTSIGAYHDTLLCAYDYRLGPTTNLVRFNINYEGANPGSQWYYGYPGRDTTTTSEFADVALRKGGGIGMVYRYYTPTRELRYVWGGYSGSFGDPVAIGDHEPFWNRPAIEYLGSSVYGVVYIRWSDSAAYFDRTDWIAGLAEQRRLVTEENILNVTPSPLSGRGRLNYTLTRPADLRVQVYDRAGRVVRTLFAGHSPAGRQSIGFDAADMVPGVYFVRATAGGMTLTVPVTVVK